MRIYIFIYLFIYRGEQIILDGKESIVMTKCNDYKET
jgi:hypothetical protein